MKNPWPFSVPVVAEEPPRLYMIRHHVFPGKSRVEYLTHTEREQHAEAGFDVELIA